ncbi:MAG: hypothetical protein JWQ25_2230 [Daejeonella sp.]|nr:hypothetical protein [Daejeonella sp.]
MKILIPVLSLGKSGGFRVMSELANSWINSGHEVSFLIPISTNNSVYFPTKANIIWVNNKGETMVESAISQENYSLYNCWKALYLAINSLAFQVDIVLANHSLSVYPIIFSAIRAKKFYYIQAYEPEYYQEFGGYKNKIIMLLSWLSYFFNFTKIVNADIYCNYKNISAERVVYPGLDLDKFYPANTKRSDKIVSSNNAKIVKIGCIGRIEPFKGTSYVLEAFQILQKTNDNFKFELHIAFGEFDLSTLNSDIKVVIPGNDVELGSYYRSLDILVAPGTVQLGAVHYPVIEAMACRIPVITTGYYPADITNSWIVPIKSAIPIVNAIEAILSDEESCEQKINKAEVDVQQFKWEVVSNKMIGYFN